jgi:hypothetical protein
VTVQPIGPGQTQAYNALEAQQLFLQKAGLLGEFGFTSPTDNMIFLGPDYVTQMVVPKRGPRGTSGKVPTQQAYALFTRLDEEQRERFNSAVEGFTGSRPEGTTAYYRWKEIVDLSGVLSQAYGRDVDPFETAEIFAAAAPAKPSGTGKPTTTVSTTETVDLSNPSEARRLLDNTLGAYLGRVPSQKEYSNFLRVLNSTEEASPTITQQTTRTVPGEGTSRVKGKVRSEGGVSREQVAAEYVRGREDYAETRLSNTGLSAFLELLG